MPATILITGSTGQIGYKLVKMASAQGIPVRAAIRSKDKAVPMPNVEWVEADFDKPETFDAALGGIEKVFLLTPFVSTLAEMSNAFVDRAKKAGVKHVVRLSATGANPKGKITLSRWQGAAEQYIQDSGLSWTMLRPTFFMENLLNNAAGTIKAQGKFYMPHGEGKAAYIATRDIAAVALETLTRPGHEGKIYELTGSESLSNGDIAGVLSRVTGKSVEYVDVPEDIARQSMTGMGMPPWMIESLMELNNILKQGWTAKVGATLTEITGKEATSFEQFANEHKSAWN